MNRFFTRYIPQKPLLLQVSCLFIFALILGCPIAALSSDDEIGTIKLSRFLLEPTFAWRDPDTIDRATSETRRTGFGLQQYQLAARWETTRPSPGILQSAAS